MRFQATLTDGKTSALEVVAVEFESGFLRITGEATQLEVALRDCRFHPPLGRIRRAVDLPGGAVLESDDLETVDAIGRHSMEGHGLRFVHALESRWRMVVASIGVVIAFVWVVYQFGIPVIAKDIAFRLPVSVLRVATDQTTPIIEKFFLDETELPEDRIEEIQKGFDEVVTAIGDETYEYKLHFREAGGMPNAFALPSGDIYVTDALIENANSDREIFAVFAHEVTHVEKRHGMRMVLQSTGVLFLTSVMLGDVVSASTLGAALPTVLAESGYSRHFENEADEGAGHYCVNCGWGTGPMRDFLTRIAPPGAVPEMSWLTSHPDTAERVRLLLKLEKKLGGESEKEKEEESEDGEVE